MRRCTITPLPQYGLNYPCTIQITIKDMDTTFSYLWEWFETQMIMNRCKVRTIKDTYHNMVRAVPNQCMIMVRVEADENYPYKTPQPTTVLFIEDSSCSVTRFHFMSKYEAFDCNIIDIMAIIQYIYQPEESLVDRFIQHTLIEANLNDIYTTHNISYGYRGQTPVTRENPSSISDNRRITSYECTGTPVRQVGKEWASYTLHQLIREKLDLNRPDVHYKACNHGIYFSNILASIRGVTQYKKYYSILENYDLLYNRTDYLRRHGFTFTKGNDRDYLAMSAINTFLNAMPHKPHKVQ